MKNPLTPAGIEPATFRFVAQHPNHCATAVPLPYKYPSQYYQQTLLRTFSLVQPKIDKAVQECVQGSRGIAPLIHNLVSK